MILLLNQLQIIRIPISEMYFMLKNKSKFYRIHITHLNAQVDENFIFYRWFDVVRFMKVFDPDNGDFTIEIVNNLFLS